MRNWLACQGVTVAACWRVDAGRTITAFRLSRRFPETAEPRRDPWNRHFAGALALCDARHRVPPGSVGKSESCNSQTFYLDIQETREDNAIMEIFTHLRQLGRDTVFYGLGSVLGKFIGLFLFPIYTRTLTQEAFGEQDLVFTAIIVTSYVLALGLDAGTARHYFDAETPADRTKILSTWLWFQVCTSVPICMLLIGFAEPLCTAIFNDPALAPFLRVGLATLPFTLVTSVALLSLRLTFQSHKFAIISAAGVLVHGLAAICLVAILRMGVMGVFLAYLIASVFRAALGIGFTHRHFRPVFSKSWLMPILAFGVPLVPASLSLWVLNYSNRYFLVRFGTLSDIALLGVGVRVSSIVTLGISAFQIAWGPFAYSLMNDESLARATYSRVLTYFLLVSFVGTVGVGVFAREAVLVLATPSYESSASVVSWLCYGSIAWGASYIVGIGYGIAKKSYHATISTLLAAVVNTGLNFLLIPKWGIAGAAASSMWGSLTALVYGYCAAQRYLPVKYEFRKVFTLLGAATTIICAGILVDRSLPSWSPIVLLLKLLLSAMFVLSLFVLGAISREEVTRVRAYLVSTLAGSGVR